MKPFFKLRTQYILTGLMFMLLFLGYPFLLFAQTQKPRFTVIPLGVKGGLDECNLSAYLVGAAETNSYVCVDAGTLRSGAEIAVRKKAITGTASQFLRRNIKGFLISHPHLDHVAGLILNSPDDTAKPIYGLPFTIKTLQQAYFTWQSWANFGDAGQPPLLKKYHYVSLSEDRDTMLQNTGLSVTAFPLSHASPGESTAFLIRNENDYLLYLGDTGPDSVEHSKRLFHLWQTIAPLVKAHRLRAIFIEVSYFNEQPNTQLFGHLTPCWLMREMDVLNEAVGGEGALNGFPVVVTHSKYFGEENKKLQAQIQKENGLQLKLIFPQQGRVYRF